MSYEEALEWLTGEHSLAYAFDPSDYLFEYHLGRAEAARTQQAYYIVKAKNEGWT